MPDLMPLRKTGDASNRVDMVIVAEGYTADEKQKFIEDAQNFVNNLLEQGNARLNSPFSNYANYFNVTGVFFASNQSGIDQPNNNIYVNTYFNASQYGSDGRLIYGMEQKVLSEVNNLVANNAQDLIIVLCNTDVYGGAGGNIAWATSGNKFSSELVLHEIGHSYAGLQDEYIDTSAIAQHPLSSREFLNSQHLTGSPSYIPWQVWMGYEDGELGKVGLYEGGYYRTKGVWRATLDSKMNNLDKPFNAPEKEAFILQYYKDIGDYLSLKPLSLAIYQAEVPDTSLLKFSVKSGDTLYQVSPDLIDAYALSLMLKDTPYLITQDNSGMVRKDTHLTEQTELIPTNFTVLDKLIANDTVQTDYADKIVRFGDVNNVVKLNDIMMSIDTYIDLGKGDDVLQINSTLDQSSNFRIKQTAQKSFILEKEGGAHISTLNAESLRFNNYVVNTEINANSKTIAEKELNTLLDLYVAYFNRVPDADGLNYWINRYKAGMNFTQIGEAFFYAASEKSEQTGYNLNLSNTDLIHKIYKNALGRSSGADEAGLKYWLDDLNKGMQTRGSMVLAIVTGAHLEKGAAEWGWVADTLDNKLAVAKKFAVEWGLNFTTPELSITETMKIAQFVTATDMSAAINLIGIAEGQIQFY